MEMPKPSQEHQRLCALLGEWIGDETLSPSPWGPGGRAIAHVTTRLELDGFYVVQDYVEEKDGRVTFRGHGLFSYDTQAREYCRYWFDSIGFVPDAPARGAWEDDTLTFRYSSPRGQARYTYRFESDRLHHVRLENSFDQPPDALRLPRGEVARVAAHDPEPQLRPAGHPAITGWCARPVAGGPSGSPPRS